MLSCQGCAVTVVVLRLDWDREAQRAADAVREGAAAMAAPEEAPPPEEGAQGRRPSPAAGDSALQLAAGARPLLLRPLEAEGSALGLVVEDSARLPSRNLPALEP